MKPIPIKNMTIERLRVEYANLTGHIDLRDMHISQLQAENKELKAKLAYIDKHFTCPCDSKPSGCGDNPNELCGLKQIVIGKWTPPEVQE